MISQTLIFVLKHQKKFLSLSHKFHCSLGALRNWFTSVFIRMPAILNLFLLLWWDLIGTLNYIGSFSTMSSHGNFSSSAANGILPLQLKSKKSWSKCLGLTWLAPNEISAAEAPFVKHYSTIFFFFSELCTIFRSPNTEELPVTLMGFTK